MVRKILEKERSDEKGLFRQFGFYEGKERVSVGYKRKKGKNWIWE